jgi:ABC-type uncharacterized transport system permease subunit
MRLRVLTGPLGAVAIVVVLGSATMLAAGVSPIVGFAALVGGALGGRQQIAETLVQTTALLFPALGICLAFRGGLFNIGAEGQLLAGGLCAAAAGIHAFAPAPLEIAAVLCAGALGGAAWGAIAGMMKARLQASEIISTLMLNFVALFAAQYLVNGPLRAPHAAGPETAALAPQAVLPVLIPQTRLTIALPLAVLLAIVLQFVLSRTTYGFALRALGDAPEAARRNGIAVARTTWTALALSGACAGLGGAAIVMGELHRFNTQLSPGYGFIAIAVALVGDLQPLWVCLSALAFGMLQSGGLAMQAIAQVPKDAIGVIEGVIVLVLAARRYIVTKKEIAAA